MIDALSPETHPARSRRRLGRWVAGAVVVVVLVLAAVVVIHRPSRSAPAAAPTNPVIAVAPLVVPRPAASAPTSDWQAWVTQQAVAAMKRQTAALLSGDFAAYLSTAVPGAKGQAGSWFRSLRALHVTRFDQRIDGNPWAPAKAGGDWRLVTVVDHCFVENDCGADLAEFDSRWRVTPDGLRLTGFGLRDPTQACSGCMEGGRTLSRPWQTTELAARIGNRTLVAVPLAYRSRLPDLSRRAEAAAVLADRYTVGTGRVDRYRIFLADPVSFKLWYEGSPAAWVAGMAVPTGRNRIETEVLVSQMTPGYADELLRHELAHVSTLRNDNYYGRGDVWWLVEGMADQVALTGDPDAAAGERRKLRRFLRSHRLPSVAVTPPGDKASVADAAGRYAVGYFALQHLIAKYGRGATLTFFQKAVQEGIGLDSASLSAFHQPWAKVNRESAAAVRALGP